MRENCNKYLSHTFVICAYKESPYLEECIQSVLNQEMRSEVIITTSTPNEYIEHLANKYNISLFINNGAGGIANDWNFALDKANTDLVTLAHQDDVYLPQYSKTIIDLVKKAKYPLIAFSEGGELRNGSIIKTNLNLIIKRMLLLPLRVSFLKSSIFMRRISLSFGNCICCPAVTYVKSNIQFPIFTEGFRSNLDWEAWERISRLKGDFLYSPRVGMLHRIHSVSETSATIKDNIRTKEDYAMFRKFWPDLIAKGLARVYQLCEKSNSL